MKDTKLIGAEQIREVITYEDVVNSIRQAFKAYNNNKASMPPKTYIDIPEHNGDFRSMPAYIHTEDTDGAGVKWVNVHPDNEVYPTVMAVVIYSDPETGFPLAVLNGTEITGIRTGGVAGVATDRFAKENIDSVGVVGAGAQSYEQIKSISSVRDFDTIRISDIDDTKVNEFRNSFSDEYDIVRGTPEEIANQSDVISTITPVEDPIISNVADGVHINAMGADAEQKQEFETSIITDENTSVFVDDMEQALHSGEVSVPYMDGDLEESAIESTLGSALNNDANYADETTIFDSTGLAIQDIAVADLVFDRVNDGDTQTFRFV